MTEPLIASGAWTAPSDQVYEMARKVKQCPEGLMIREPALLSDGQRSFVGDRTSEYRCELQQDHIDWHEDGEYRWKSY